jgi:hypothetical protein
MPEKGNTGTKGGRIAIPNMPLVGSSKDEQFVMTL